MELQMTPPPERGQGWLMPVLAWPVVMFQGLFASLADAQRWLHCETTRMISFIASGDWPDPAFERAFEGPVWSTWQQSVHHGVVDAAPDGSNLARE